MGFSIIIPHYNSADTLEILIKSIPITRDIQVIVIDDNSDIMNKKKLENLTNINSFIKLINNDTGNKGAGACRNLGLRYANQDWVLFADADDKFSKNFYEIINKYSQLDKDIIFFPPKSFTNNDDEQSLRHLTFKKLVDCYLEENNIKNTLRLKVFFVVPWSKLIKRKLIMENEIFFEEILLSNDIMFSAKIGLKAKSISVVNKNIYLVRHSSGSMTSIKNQERFLLRFDAWIDYIDYIRNNTTVEEFKILNISGTPKIIEAIRLKLSIKKFLYLLRTLYSKKIPLIDLRIFNLKFLYNKILFYFGIWKNEKKFFSNK